jgi:hypothetical protein
VHRIVCIGLEPAGFEPANAAEGVHRIGALSETLYQQWPSAGAAAGRRCHAMTHPVLH